MPRLTAIATATPPNRLEQRVARGYAEHLLKDAPELNRILKVFDSAGVAQRYVAQPVPWYLEPHGWEDRTRAFIDVGLDLLERASTAALDTAGVDRGNVDGIIMVTSTGLSTPSLEARLANRLGLRPDLLRVPIWGLGCAGGVAGLARAADLAAARPKGRFLLLSLELCSLAFLRERLDKKLLVAGALFGDGCAAALVEGDDVADPAAPRWAGSASHQWRDTESVMGWDVRDEGLDVVFDPVIPQFVEAHIREPVDALLGSERPDAYAFHPGGAKVLDALQKALALPAAALDASRDVLREYGNMSSPTFLYVLERVLRNRPGNVLAGALGPGFASELALVRSEAT